MAIVIPPDLRDFHKVFERTQYTHDSGEVLDTLLEFVLWSFCADKSLDWAGGQRFKENERPIFWELVQAWVAVMNAKIKADGDWYDLPGTYYEAYVASKSRRDSRGQFFTPEHICTLMAKINGCEDDTTGKTISDTCCGSGRFLLAYHAFSPGNFMVAEDVDRTCCLMTVCNFLFHGVVGEVVWHDSLMPESWHYGWRVNANLNNPPHPLNGIPHVETLQKENSRVWRHWEARRREVEVECQQVPVPVIAQVDVPVIAPPSAPQQIQIQQLTLF